MIRSFMVTTLGRQSIIDIQQQVEGVVGEAGVAEGTCTVYVPHATAAVIINENADPNIQDDLLTCLEGLIPQGRWLHDRVDGNAAAHIKASIIGPSETVLIREGRLVMGTWQSLMLCCFDGPRQREVLVQVR